MTHRSRVVRAVVMLAVGGALSGCGQQATPSPSESPSVTVPTLSPVIPDSQLASRLLVVLGDNLKDHAVASCVHEALMEELATGQITRTDVDNYVRNVTTDGMRNALVQIQDAGMCKAS